MVISNFYQNRALHACQARIHTVSTVLLKSVRFFIIDILSCKASFEEKELAKLSCLNDSETQERRLWEVKIEKNFPLGHAPRPPKSLQLRRSFRKSVSINPRSAPASRFCSCFIIRKLKQRRFWVMHVSRKWIPNLYSLGSFLSRKRFAGKKNGQIRAPKLQKRHIWLKCVAQKTSYVLKSGSA